MAPCSLWSLVVFLEDDNSLHFVWYNRYVLYLVIPPEIGPLKLNGSREQVAHSLTDLHKTPTANLWNNRGVL